MLTKWLFVLLLCLATGKVYSQIPVTGSLRVYGDTVRYTFTARMSSDRLVFSQLDSVNKFNAPRRYEGKNSAFIFESGDQKVRADHNDGKVPFQRIALTDDRQTKYLQVNFFGELKAHYSQRYRARFKDKIVFEIPEVYELANIAMALTEVGKQDANMARLSGAYAAAVNQHFAGFASHPLIVRLGARLKKDGYNFYYGVRENAYTISFDAKGELVNSGIYDNMWPGVNDIAEYADQWEAFVNASKFREFYRSHQQFYKSDIANVKGLLPVKKMQVWLQNQFPGIRYDCQRIVFSPLIAGAHSAQKFSDQGFTESLMFICDAEIFDANKYTPAQIQALYSGIVFTEIDHNFVNPTSDKHLQAINAAFSGRSKWVRQGQASDYGSPYEVFNEYMTHAVHLLYVKENFPKPVYDLVKAERVTLNSSQRGFYAFDKFYQQLEMQYATKKGNQTIADLYPAILAWCNEFNK